MQWLLDNHEVLLRKTILAHFQTHKNDPHIQFLIYWKNLPIHSLIQDFCSTCKLYDHNIKFKSNSKNSFILNFEIGIWLDI